MNQQENPIHSSKKSLLPSLSSAKLGTTPAYSTKSIANDKFQTKKVLWKVSQKDLKQWQVDLERISKEELALKRALKDLTNRYQRLIEKYHENFHETELPEDKKQKELERSLMFLNTLLNSMKKKRKNMDY